MADNQNVVAPLTGAMEQPNAMEQPDAMTSSPLQGKRILVTRTPEQASPFSERLRALGAISVEFPTIRLLPPHDWEALDNALKKLFLIEGFGDSSSRPYYTWVVFTSANGVKICCERLRSLGYDPSTISNVRVAAIGPTTAATLARYGIIAELVPTEYVAEGVAAAIIQDAQRAGETLQGKRVLVARAAEARRVLVTQLLQAGAEVEEVAAYHTVSATSDDEQGQNVLRLLQTHQLDIITFTSSSTVRHFIHWLQECQTQEGHSPVALVTDNPALKIACIGPITSQTARTLGLDVHIEAKSFTTEGLIEAIIEHFEHEE